MDVKAMLARAAELGRQVEAIAGDVSRQRLSREAWMRQCIEYGGFADEAALDAVRVQIEALRTCVP